MIIEPKLHVVELVTGQKLICKKEEWQGHYDAVKLTEAIWLMVGMGGQMQLVPYTAVGKVDTEIVVRTSHIICTYELDDANLKASHAKAWGDYKQKKTGIVTPEKKIIGV